MQRAPTAGPRAAPEGFRDAAEGGAVHRDLARALSPHAAPIIRRISRGGMVARSIPDARPGSHRA